MSETFRYPQVLRALASVFSVDDPQIPALKARLTNFQRLGFVPSSPGRGKVRDYTASDVYDWGLGLALVLFSPPGDVAKVLRPGAFLRLYHDALEQSNDGMPFLIVTPTLFDVPKLRVVRAENAPHRNGEFCIDLEELRLAINTRLRGLVPERAQARTGYAEIVQRAVSTAIGSFNAVLQQA